MVGLLQRRKDRPGTSDEARTTQKDLYPFIRDSPLVLPRCLLRSMDTVESFQLRLLRRLSLPSRAFNKGEDEGNGMK